MKDYPTSAASMRRCNGYGVDDPNCAGCAALRRENASHLAVIDALTKQAQDASDKRNAVQLAAGVRAVHAMLRHVTGKVALGHDERPWVDAVKAWCTENGASVYEEVSR